MLPDTLWMYAVRPGPVEDSDGNEVTLLEMLNDASLEFDEEDELIISTARITGYHVLEACSDENMEKAGESLENGGSMDAMTDVDFIAEDCSVRDRYGAKIRNASVGDRLFLSATLTNRSYATLDLSGQAYAMLTWTITCDDEPVSIRETQIWFDDSDPFSEAPNKAYTVKLGEVLIPQEPGDYTVSFEIDGIFTGDGEPVTEAYTVNNSSAVCRFTVAGTATGAETAPRDPETEIVRPVPTIETTFRQGAAEACELVLPGQDAEGLVLLEDGKIVPEEQCTIAGRGTDTVLCFTKEFVDSTFEGIRFYLLQDADGADLAWINVQIGED